LNQVFHAETSDKGCVYLQKLNQNEKARHNAWWTKICRKMAASPGFPDETIIDIFLSSDKAGSEGKSHAYVSNLEITKYRHKHVSSQLIFHDLSWVHTVLDPWVKLTTINYANKYGVHAVLDLVQSLLLQKRNTPWKLFLYFRTHK
jgi:hypothetical protein